MIHGFDNPFDFDQALLAPVWYMMERGMLIDERVKFVFHGKYHAQWEDAQMKLNSLAGQEINVNSPKQMKEFIYNSLAMPKRFKEGKLTTDEDALRALLAIAQDKHVTSKTDTSKLKWLRAYMALMLILKIRALRKRISSYIDVDLDSDARMRCTISVGGTETFRFSCSKTLWDTGCNRQTIPRELRRMFIADPGKEIAEFDLNRGESWVYSHLANEPEMMRIHREGEDFHTITACAISSAFGEPIRYDDWPDFAAADAEGAYKLRFLGKKTNHARAYRMGDHRAMEVVNSESDDTGITIVAREAKLAGELWLQRYPFIKTWWSGIEAELGKARTLTTPYGRTRQFFDRWGDHLFKEATAYVPQSTSVDYINGGMLRVYHDLVLPCRWGVELLHQNHDSILIQYDEGSRSKVIPAVIDLLESTVIVGGHEITIPVEAQYGHSWGTMTEWVD
jgi:DNA polymerase-1